MMARQRLLGSTRFGRVMFIYTSKNGFLAVNRHFVLFAFRWKSCSREINKPFDSELGAGDTFSSSFALQNVMYLAVPHSTTDPLFTCDFTIDDAPGCSHEDKSKYQKLLNFNMNLLVGSVTCCGDGSDLMG